MFQKLVQFLCTGLYIIIANKFYQSTLKLTTKTNCAAQHISFRVNNLLFIEYSVFVLIIAPCVYYTILTAVWIQIISAYHVRIPKVLSEGVQLSSEDLFFFFKLIRGRGDSNTTKSVGHF